MRYSKVDSLCVISPVALFIAVLQIFAWGVTTINVAIFILTLIIFFINFRAILRFMGSLFIDHYSVPFILFSIIFLLVTLAFIAFIIIFKPLVQPPAYYDISKKCIKMTGSFSSGFLPSNAFERGNAVITIFEKVRPPRINKTPNKDISNNLIDTKDSVDAASPAKTENNIDSDTNITADTLKNDTTPLARDDKTPGADTFNMEQSKNVDNPSASIILLGDKRASLDDYLPYVYQLANLGYKVYYADFFTRDNLWAHNICDSKLLRKSFMQLQYFLSPFRFNSEQEYFSFNISKELAMLYEYATNQNGDQKVFVVTDWMGDIALRDFQKLHSADKTFSGAIYLSDYKEYKTIGFGFTDFSNPLTSVFLKMNREHYASFIEAAKSYFKEVESKKILPHFDGVAS